LETFRLPERLVKVVERERERVREKFPPRVFPPKEKFFSIGVSL
jgi:hypothetical protein